MTALTCRDCGSAEVLVIEKWTASIEFDPAVHTIADGVLTIIGDGQLVVGEPTGQYEARCLDCDKQWVLRREVAK